MTGLIRKATLLVVLMLVAAVSVATAGVPDKNFCTTPAYIDLVGCTGTTPDPIGTFTVRIADLGNFPVANQLVTVSFNNQVAIYDVQPGFVSCQNVSATTNILGIATFCIAGAGNNTNGLGTWTGANAASFYIGNCGEVLIRTAHVTTFDQGGFLGSPGVGVTDLSALGADFNLAGGRPLVQRSDFDHSGATGVLDISYWGRVFNGGLSSAACGTLCATAACP